MRFGCVSNELYVKVDLCLKGGIRRPTNQPFIICKIVGRTASYCGYMYISSRI